LQISVRREPGPLASELSELLFGCERLQAFNAGWNFGARRDVVFRQLQMLPCSFSLPPVVVEFIVQILIGFFEFGVLDVMAATRPGESEARC